MSDVQITIQIEIYYVSYLIFQNYKINKNLYIIWFYILFGLAFEFLKRKNYFLCGHIGVSKLRNIFISQMYYDKYIP